MAAKRKATPKSSPTPRRKISAKKSGGAARKSVRARRVSRRSVPTAEAVGILAPEQSLPSEVRRAQSSPFRLVAAFFGLALALISVGGFVIHTVNAATYTPPTALPPGGNIPAIIWNRATSSGTQVNASIDIDGGVSSGGMSQFGKNTLPLTGSQNLIYGNVQSGTANASLLLLQNNGVTKFRVDPNGNVSYAGGIAASGCFGRVFLGLTASTYTPSLAAVSSGPNAGLAGYYSADNACASQYAGSHVCKSDELLESIQCSTPSDPIRTNGGNFAWVNSGPPGASAFNASDCLGWTSVSASIFGRVWAFDNVTGGRGTLTGCNIPVGLKYACCK